MARGGKSGSRKRRPKPRGDAARAARMTAVAREAASSALQGEARRRTLIRMISTLVERLGGNVRIPFREVSGAPPLTMVVEGQDTPGAVMVLTVGAREPGSGIMEGDQVVVHSYTSTLDYEAGPERTGLELRGTVAQIDEGTLLVVRLEPGNELELERVVVPREWVRLEEHADASTRVDAGCCETTHRNTDGSIRDKACADFEEGANGRCVYCDHDARCHPGSVDDPRPTGRPL